MIFGGHRTPSETISAKTEKWDGTSWTEVGDLATARTQLGSGQSSPTTAAIAFGGEKPPGSTKSTDTEEWNDPVYSIKTVTVS